MPASVRCNPPISIQLLHPMRAFYRNLALSAFLLALLGTLAYWVPGDRAAFFGALALCLVPLIPLSLDLLENWQRKVDAQRLDPREYRKRLQEELDAGFPLDTRAQITRAIFQSNLIAGLWLGVLAHQPLLMMGCLLLVVVATGAVANSPSRHRLLGTIRMAGTLSAAVAMGMALRLLLHDT